MSAHHDDGKLGESGMQASQKLHPVYAGEPDIQQNEGGLHGIEPLPETFRIRKYEDLIPLGLQDALYRGSDGRYVVYDTDRIHMLFICSSINELGIV
jgi:hypothetical protein